MTRIAHIGNNLTVSEMCPELMARDSLRYVQNLVRFDPDSKEMTSVLTPVEKEFFIQLKDGTWTGPRNLATEDELVAWGYQIVHLFQPTRSRQMTASAHIECRSPEQYAAYDAMMSAQQGTLVLAPGMGKTVLALKYMSERGYPALVIIENGGLMEQWYQQTIRHLQLPSCAVAKMYQKEGLHDWKNKAVVIAMYKSLLNRLADGSLPPSFLWHFGTVVWDEAHHTQAFTMSQTLNIFTGARLALSATPHYDGREAIYFAHIGPPIFEHRKPDVVPNVSFHPVRIPGIPFWHPGSMQSNVKMLDFCLNPKAKPQKIVIDGKDKLRVPAIDYLDYVVSVLNPMIEQGHEMLIIGTRRASMWYLKEKLVGDVGIIDSSVPFSERADICLKHQVVIASRRIGEEALDKPKTTRVVSLTPLGHGAKNAIQQTAGRGTRWLPGKTRTEYHVFFPQGAYGLSLANGMVTSCLNLGYTIDLPPAKEEKASKSAMNDKAALGQLQQMQRMLGPK